MQNKILFLEDDEVLAESLVELLTLENYDVSHVASGEELLTLTFEKNFDLYLLDVNVADISGFELLKSLRESGDKTPAIFLTALRDIASLAEGFDVGADDYIKKPFDFDELLIRIKAVIQKRHQKLVKIQNFSFDFEKNELYKNGDFIILTPYELKLVEMFFKNLDATLQKEYILQALSFDKEMSDGALRVHINKLRKIGVPIVTIKGVGYRLGSS